MVYIGDFGRRLMDELGKRIPIEWTSIDRTSQPDPVYTVMGTATDYGIEFPVRKRYYGECVEWNAIRHSELITKLGYKYSLVHGWVLTVETTT